MSATKKRFSPVAYTATTADEPLPVNPARLPEPVTFMSTDALPPAATESEGTVAIAGSPEQATAVKPSMATSADQPTLNELIRPQRKPAMKEKRISFSWRITLDQAENLDRLSLDFRRQLDIGRLDRSQVMTALADVMFARKDVQDAVVARLRELSS